MEEQDINAQSTQNTNFNKESTNPSASVSPIQPVINAVPKSKKFHLLPIVALVFGVLSNIFGFMPVKYFDVALSKMLMVASGLTGLLGIILAIIALAKKQNKIISHICFFVCMIPILYIIMYLYLTRVVNVLYM